MNDKVVLKQIRKNVEALFHTGYGHLDEARKNEINYYLNDNRSRLPKKIKNIEFAMATCMCHSEFSNRTVDAWMKIILLNTKRITFCGNLLISLNDVKQTIINNINLITHEMIDADENVNDDEDYDVFITPCLPIPNWVFNNYSQNVRDNIKMTELLIFRHIRRYFGLEFSFYEESSNKINKLMKHIFNNIYDNFKPSNPPTTTNDLLNEMMIIFNRIESSRILFQCNAGYDSTPFKNGYFNTVKNIITATIKDIDVPTITENNSIQTIIKSIHTISNEKLFLYFPNEHHYANDLCDKPDITLIDIIFNEFLENTELICINRNYTITEKMLLVAMHDVEMERNIISDSAVVYAIIHFL